MHPDNSHSIIFDIFIKTFKKIEKRPVLKNFHFLPLFILLPFALSAQEVLFSEDFNNCAVPSAWQVEANGNPDAVWLVGMPDNPNSNGETIDGSCMLIFDDDATGDQTPAWKVRLTSPVFDAGDWSDIQLSMDVAFRNYNGGASLSILVFDGNAFQEVAVYQGAGSQTGEQFSDFATFTADLSFYANPEMQIAIEYDDGGVWSWWAGVDNIQITGSGTAKPVLLENFNSCGLPADWISYVGAGDSSWQIGYMNNPNSAAASMNGSCFAWFDDDANGQDAAPSLAALFSPVIDGTQYAHFYLNYDLIFRRYSEVESFSVGVYDDNTGEVEWATTYLANMGGPQLNEYIHETIDLTQFRRSAMRLVFAYNDGGEWGWWCGIDNIKVTGEGVINDLCETAIPISPDEPCLPMENTFALTTGDSVSCSHAVQAPLWYRFEAAESAWVEAVSNAGYNDVITILEGDCIDLQEVNCTNYDEFGFTGERLFWQAEQGKTYFIRVSGHAGDFGLARGEHCLELKTVSALPQPPANDLCVDAISLEIEGECLPGSNIHASMSAPFPSRNLKSRASIWYAFVPDSQNDLEILSHADFADVLTVYQGECGQLVELACNELGQRLVIEQPQADSTYYLQISGYFATLEGNVCLEINKLPAQDPVNQDCLTAFPLMLGDDCLETSNVGASFSGPPSSCGIYLDAGLWFSFTAPPSGQVAVRTEAGFVHLVSIFSGACNGLQEVFCGINPLSCAEDLIATGLTPGQTYFLRLSSLADPTGMAETGSVCIRLEDGQTVQPYEPLNLVAYTDCYDDGQAKLVVQAEGGTGDYQWEGNFNGEILPHGSNYVVLIRDDKGCEASAGGIVECPVNCDLSVEATAFGENECPNDFAGQITLETSGGSGPLSFSWPDGSTSQDMDQLASGYYTVTVTDTLACSAIAGGLIPGPPPFLFEIDAIQDAQAGENDGAVSIDFSGGTPPYTFEWYLDGSLVSIEEDPQGLAPGEYSVQITDADFCSELYEGIVVSTLVNSIQAAEWTYIQLFPNPASEKAFLDWQLAGPASVRITVFNNASQVLRQLPEQTGTEGRFVIPLENLASGLYFVKFQTKERVVVKRLIVQR